MPGEARDGISDHDPRGLHCQPVDEFSAGDFAHVHAYRKIELVGKRREKERLLDDRRENIEREHVAARNVFKGVKDKNKS